MGKIIVLDENTSNKIAAGEVIERPASVIKEMIENSIDAGSSSISVEIKNGGISFIKVTDNGSGIDEDDVEIAFERHATSKIRSANDLDSITTLGFRGEALASIAAVSNVELTSRVQKNTHGMYIRVQGGNVKEVKPVGCPVGTTFIIRDLFYNTPARFKFLKKDSTETGYISDIISRVALAKPHISFRLVSNNSTVIHTPGNNDLLSTIFSIYGKETAKEVVEINYQDSKVKISGYAGRPEIARSNRNHQSIFVNGRYIKSKVIASAIDEAYKTFLMKNRFPFIVMSLEVNPLLVDVNVHPTKMEIRFSEEQEIFRSVFHSVTNALLGKSLIKNAYVEQKDQSIFKFDHSGSSRENYVQQNISSNTYQVREKSEHNNYSIPVNKDIPILEVNKPIMQEKTLNMENKADSIKKPVIELLELRKENSKEIDNKTYQVKHTINVISEVNKDDKIFEKDTNDTFLKNTEVREKPVVPITGCEEPNKTEGYQVSEINHNEFLLNAKVIGQAFSTYVLLQYENELIMIDQHAAHERIMYEKLLHKYKNKESISQDLISPIVIELTNQEIRILEEENEFLYSLGFNYENFGNNSIMLRSIPYLDYSGSTKEVFMEVLDYVINSVKNGYKKESYINIADEVLYTLACKAAVKANKKLDDMEIKKLLDELVKLENPFTCPHGRPTIVKLKKYELEKMFKRIV